MNRNYVILPIGKIVILMGKYTTSYFKEINNKLYILSDEENNYVKSIFNKQDNLYYSKQLDKVLMGNNNINKIKNINEFLLYIESFIPAVDRDSFYQNLATLKINFSKEDVPETKRGFYRFEDNSITIYTKRLIEKQEELKDNPYASEQINTVFL
jgi:hypothetical protein